MGALPASCHSMPFIPVSIMLLTVCITFLHFPLERGETGRETPQCDLGIRLESLDPHSEKMEGIYKTDNFINDIALFVFFDLNTYLQF